MSLQATIARLMLKLPPSWLVKLSGGKPVEIKGRVLDPHFQFVAHAARGQPHISTFSAQQGRAAAAEGLGMFQAKREPGVDVENLAIPGPKGRQIPARLYRPEEQDPDAPLMVYFHSGGGVIGNLDMCDAFCSMLAVETSGPILSVDYRLAPEHKFPAGLDDCKFAYEWALKQAEAWGAMPGKAAIGGDSMGGNFSAIISQEMKIEGKPLPELQLLIYPATDLVTDYPSRTDFADAYPLGTDTMDWFMGHYVPEGVELSDSRLSPGLEASLDGLPPAIVITAGFDPLYDDGEAYAKHLEAGGVDTVYRSYDRLAHGFTAYTAVSPASDQACREIAQLVAEKYRQL